MAITRGQKAGGTLAGGLGGAATGAALGSVIPGIGTAIGAGLGGLSGLISSYLSSGPTQQQIMKKQQRSSMSQGGMQSQGLPEGVGTYNLYSPEQQQASNLVLQRALSGLGSNQFDFAPIEAQARRGFYEQTIPGIAERFSSLGSGGSQRSSAFAQQLGAAGAGLEGDLAAMRQNYGLQQQQLLQNLLGIGMRPQNEAYFRPGDESGSFGKNLAQQLLNRENLVGAGELYDWYKRRRSSGQQGLAAIDGQSVGQPFSPASMISPTSSLGSFNAMTSPGNIVSGIQAPRNQSMSVMPTSSLGSLKALYGM